MDTEHSQKAVSAQELCKEVEELRARLAQLEALKEEHQRVADQLRQEKELLESLINSSADGILAIDRQLRYTLWNPAMERLSGISKEASLGVRCFDLFPFLVEIGEDRYIYASLEGETVMARDRPFTIPETGKEGFTDARYTPIYGPAGEIVGSLGIIRDVTERKRNEDTLRQVQSELEERVRERTAALEREIAERRKIEVALELEKEISEGLINSTRDGILAYDNDFNYTIWNPIMEKMSGLSREEAIGNNMFEMFPFLEETGEDQYLRAALEGEAQINRDRIYKAPRTGKEGFFDAYYLPIYATGGEIIGGLNIINDVTERKELEEERLKASKLESLGLLAGGLAHDFNNILTGILSYCAVAQMHVEEDSKAFQALESAERACERATKLTDQLLTFARGGRPVKEVVSLATLVQESASFAVGGSSARCKFEIDRKAPAAEVDPGQISQVIHNIILNACQAMPDAGTIRVGVHNCEIDADNYPSLPPGNYLEIVVQDEGTGMSDTVLEKIFDPYYTTKEKGSGLGLATSYSIIKNHGGLIDVASELGVGTTFRIFVPATDAEPPQRQQDETTAIIGHAKILVLDDDEMIRESTRDILTLLGFEVVIAANGHEALELFDAARDQGRPFHIVMLDLTVPGGMGGKETIELLRQRDPHVKAIVASAYSEDPVMASYEAHGFDGRLVKPFPPQELSRVLQRVLISGF